MIITEQAELEALQRIGAIVARTRDAMLGAIEPGMTTAELDALGRASLEREGAVSAPEGSYGFPGATCISLNEECAHGIPGSRVIRAGDLINVDVSASRDGFFGDTGASMVVPGLSEPRPLLERLCRDGATALQLGIEAVRADHPLGAIGRSIGSFATERGYTLVRNLASHGIGRALHEEPEAVPTWPDRRERRQIREGMVLTVEPFLSLGATWADKGADGWTLFATPSAPTVQFEHTVVATRRGPLILTLDH